MGAEDFRQFDFGGWHEDPTSERDRLREVDFDIPEQAWVTWGGQIALQGGNPNFDAPFQEVARIECPSPRSLTGTIALHGDPVGGQVIELQLFQGVGRVDLRRDFSMFVPSTLDLFVPGRMLRLLARIHPQSPPGTDILVQGVFAPEMTWLDERLAERRKHKL